MTVRFKCQSEYQRSYGTSRSRSVSPQRCVPLAGLRSDHMGTSQEPGLQRRRKMGSGGLARSCGSLLFPPEPQFTPHLRRTAPPAGRNSHRKETKPPTPPGEKADPETPPGPRPAADPEPAADPGPPVEPRPQTAAPDGQRPSANEVQPALQWKAGLRSGSRRSEYHREFTLKNPAAASPLLAAQQALRTKKNPVTMETEYQHSFQGLAPPIGPRLRKHLEHQRLPLFHVHMSNRKKREESEKKTHPKADVPTHQTEEVPPPQVQGGLRQLTEYQSSFHSPPYRTPEEGGATDSDAPQVVALRQQAASYRRRAWGTNFSRDHLSQLQSEHNVLWEPSESTDSAPPTPCLASDPPQVEALELHSRSSRRSSDTQHTPTDTHAAGAQEEQEEEDTDEEEGRLPTPRLKMLPVQRTHHDLTTPAAVQISSVGPPGGALLVGKLRSSEASSLSKQQGCGSAVAMAAGAETTTDRVPRRREAWSENGPSPDNRPTGSVPSKPTRPKPLSPVAPPLVAPPPHCIQGSLRRPDFQHNGELGLRLRQLQRVNGGHAPDEDDRLSVMSWRSAASCSAASAVLERAQRRRENFWGKR